MLSVLLILLMEKSDNLNMHENLYKVANRNIDDLLLTLRNSREEMAQGIVKSSIVIANSIKEGGKVLICGNGGSAAQSQHIAAELINKLNFERKSLPAIALTTDTSCLTAIGNDCGFAKIFSRQVEGLVEENDVVIGISTSGKSESVIKGLITAKGKKAKTVLLTGESAGELKEVDYVINVPSKSTPRIQEAHIMIGHIICSIVESELFNEKD